MKANIGKTDRWIRIIVGLGILVAGFVFKSWWGLVGLVPLLTAIIRWCPLYVPCGLSSCKTEQSNKA